jgi:hypothetical protein
VEVYGTPKFGDGQNLHVAQPIIKVEAPTCGHRLSQFCAEGAMTMCKRADIEETTVAKTQPTCLIRIYLFLTSLDVR